MSAAGGVDEEILALSVRNEQIRSQISGLREFVDSLQRLVEALDQSREDDVVMSALDESLAHAVLATGAAVAVLLVLDEDSSELVTVLARPLHEDGQLLWRRSPAASGFAGWALRQRQPLIANDARSDERFDANVDLQTATGVHSVLVVPVSGRSRTLGVFQFVNKSDHGMFDEDDQTLVALMSRFAGELMHRMSR